jgi:hypothetical protein
VRGDTYDVLLTDFTGYLAPNGFLAELQTELGPAARETYGNLVLAIAEERWHGPPMFGAIRCTYWQGPAVAKDFAFPPRGTVATLGHRDVVCVCTARGSHGCSVSRTLPKGNGYFRSS